MRNMTSKGVAEILGVRPTTVQRYAREGRIPFAATPGGHRRFDIDEVRAALAQPTFRGAQPKPARLGQGADVAVSTSAELDARLGQVRAERTEPDAGQVGGVPGPSAVQTLIADSRRILVATGG